MKFYVGVTDNDWFRFLRVKQPEEVNFWKPGETSGFKAIEPGAPFLFKLKKPYHVIVGGGYFVDYVRLPLSYAWDAFGEKNGLPDKEKFAKKINSFRNASPDQVLDLSIGCIILTSPFFLDESDWIPAPKDWANSIVQGKRFESTEGEGRAIWEQISPYLWASKSMERVQEIGNVTPAGRSSESLENYGDRPVLGPRYLRTARLGQGAFRALILDKYNCKCCVTGENTVPVLQAAHIKPVSANGTHSLKNGLLMRADIHILFDQGLVGVTPDYKIKISSQIREKFLNGKVYYTRDGQEICSRPSDPQLLPDPALLEWHMNNCFRP